VHVCGDGAALVGAAKLSMRSPDCLKVLLQVRSQAEELEERKLTAINDRLKLATAELGRLSADLERITATRMSEIQSIAPNIHHQAVEAQSRALWRRCTDQAAEIKKLKEAQTKQMSAYLSAHREREVMENLHARRSAALEMERRLREQKLNEDLFLARRAAKWDTSI